MTSRPLKRLAYRPALRSEDLDEALRRLSSDMAGAASELAAKTAVKSGDGQVFDSTEPPDLTDQAEAALRALLEEETLALVEADGERGIRVHELTHELQKKALAGLKRDTLAVIAKTRGMKPSTKLDDLAAQVAASYDWDDQAIARLILDYAEDPRVTEGGPSSRLFMLADPIDLKRTAERLSYVDGRYYRTDIAKWFTFEQVVQHASSIEVDGRLRTYAVAASADTTEQDDDKLVSKPAEFGAKLVVNDGNRLAVVHNAASANVARSVMAALKVATRDEALRYLPDVGAETEVQPRTLHQTTAWLLDLVNHRLRTHLFREKNAVLARFRYTRREAAANDSSKSRKSKLRAVRFEGENLMVSPAACGLMWTEGRPLVDLTMMVTATASARDTTVRRRLPVRIAVENDHILVSTGLISDSRLVEVVHQSAVEQVQSALLHGVDPGRRAALEQAIRKQAETPDPDAEDVLLGD